MSPLLAQAAAAHDALPLIDHAARSSDRWLFVATLLVGFGSTTWLFRWLVGTYTNLIEKLAAVLQRNTDAFDRNSHLSAQMAQAIESCRRKGDTK